MEDEVAHLRLLLADVTAAVRTLQTAVVPQKGVHLLICIHTPLSLHSDIVSLIDPFAYIRRRRFE